MNGSVLLGRGLLLLAAISPGVPSSGQQCPDVRASQVDARTYWTGTVVRCGVGIRFFGITIGFGGPECAPRRVTEPAHQTCLGEPNRGTMCLPAGPLPVTFETCHCSRATVLGTGLLFPDCECETGAGDIGHVEDFMTVPCEPKIEATVRE